MGNKVGGHRRSNSSLGTTVESPHFEHGGDLDLDLDHSNKNQNSTVVQLRSQQPNVSKPSRLKKRNLLKLAKQKKMNRISVSSDKLKPAGKWKLSQSNSKKSKKKGKKSTKKSSSNSNSNSKRFRGKTTKQSKYKVADAEPIEPWHALASRMWAYEIGPGTARDAVRLAHRVNVQATVDDFEILAAEITQNVHQIQNNDMEIEKQEQHQDEQCERQEQQEEEEDQHHQENDKPKEQLQDIEVEAKDTAELAPSVEQPLSSTMYDSQQHTDNDSQYDLAPNVEADTSYLDVAGTDTTTATTNSQPEKTDYYAEQLQTTEGLSSRTSRIETFFELANSVSKITNEHNVEQVTKNILNDIETKDRANPDISFLALRLFDALGNENSSTVRLFKCLHQKYVLEAYSRLVINGPLEGIQTADDRSDQGWQIDITQRDNGNIKVVHRRRDKIVMMPSGTYIRWELELLFDPSVTRMINATVQITSVDLVEVVEPTATTATSATSTTATPFSNPKLEERLNQLAQLIRQSETNCIPVC